MKESDFLVGILKELRINKRMLAHICGVHPNTVTQWDKKGYPDIVLRHFGLLAALNELVSKFGNSVSQR